MGGQIRGDGWEGELQGQAASFKSAAGPSQNRMKSPSSSVIAQG